MTTIQLDDLQNKHKGLKIKQLDFYFDEGKNEWTYRDSSPNVRPDAHLSMISDDDSEEYCFFVVRELPAKGIDTHGVEATFSISIKSPHLLKACRDVMQHIPGISWTEQPLEVC